MSDDLKQDAKTEELRRKYTLCCRKCRIAMKQVKLGATSLFDLSSLFAQNAYYCDEKECERFGDLTVAGYPLDDSVDEYKPAEEPKT